MLISNSSPYPHLIYSNLTAERRIAFTTLRNLHDFIIKSAAKGGAIMVWRKDVFIQDCESQLSNYTFYSPR